MNEKLLTTPDRQQLYNLSEAMYALNVDRHKFDPEDLLAGEMRIAENFHQLEQALPLLSEQPLIF